MERHNLSFVPLLTAALGGSLLSFLLVKGDVLKQPTALKAPIATHPASASGCTRVIARVPGFKHVQPLLYSEPACESSHYEGLRSSIGSLVDQLKASGHITSASVYVRDFRMGEWTWYNGAEPYDPGSLLKVPLLLTYLSMVQEDPSLLKRTWTCERNDFDVPQFTAFPSLKAQLNVSYTVEQLLNLSLVYSDNRATVMLLRHVPPARYIKTYTDLGLPAPGWDNKSYRMNVRDYSVFMKALYNSSMLSPMKSEYALDLMTRSDFKLGLSAGLPAEVQVAHKFGEAGDQNERQLHESGVVYADGDPYLITVMTRGANTDSLASAIASISRLVYERMRTP